MTPVEALAVVQATATGFGPLIGELVRAVLLHVTHAHPELRDPPPRDTEHDIDERIDREVGR